MRAPIVLDRRLAIPLHRQIYEQWRRGILDGRFTRGERMPSTRELAGALRVSRATVATAYDQLIAEGYLDTQHGSGTFVCRDLPATARVGSAPAPAATAAAPPPRLSAFARRLRPTVQRTTPDAGAIALSTEGPTFDQFPYRLWSRLVRRHVQQQGPRLFLQATDGAGDLRLREALASYLGRSRAVRCRPDQIVIVNGSQKGLDLCARLLVDAGDEIAIEDPAYRGVRDAFAACGARVCAVPVDGEGLVVKALPRSARVVHVTPSHQFPLGVVMSLARRLDLLDWARQRHAVVIEDDYDSEYRYSGAPLPALQGLMPDSGVIYIGTFSNVMFPGLRLGYLVLPPALVEPFVQAKWLADRHTAHVEQSALADFIREGHLERHIRRTRRVYKRRRDALVESLDRVFGTHATVIGDASGMHLVVRFDSPAIAARAARRGVHLLGTESLYDAEAPASEFIIRFSGVSERALRDAVTRLAP